MSGRKEGPGVAQLAAEELEALRAEVERLAAAGKTARWNPDPEEVQRSVAQLVLTLAEFVRSLLERQALRRMDEGTLSETELEQVGQGLMRLEEALHEMAARFDLDPEDLNIDLGPFGRLL